MAVGRKVLALQADVASASDVDRVFSTVQANFGRLDILINNAGIWFRKPFMEITDAPWRVIGGFGQARRREPQDDFSDSVSSSARLPAKFPVLGGQKGFLPGLKRCFREFISTANPF